MIRIKSQRKKETREESPKEKGTENNELPSPQHKNKKNPEKGDKFSLYWKDKEIGE